MALALCAVLAVAACSSESRRRTELRTPAQASYFLTSVARRGNVDDWVLGAGAAVAAQRVWSEGRAIEDLGARIRRESGKWGCELAAASYRVGHVGVFSAGDRQALANEAFASGAKQGQVEAVYADMLKMSMDDVRSVTTAVCPNPFFG